MFNEKDIEKIMRHLHCPREEAIDILKADEEIEKGEKLFELTPEQKAAEKKARSVGDIKVTPKIRERKVDEIKKELLTGCSEWLKTQGANIEYVKTETEIKFSFNGEQYTLKLTKHRKPKGDKKC